MDDGRNPVRRRREIPERNEYQQALEWMANFVDNELGNRRGPRPDDREWRIQRPKTIRILDEFREKLDTVCVRANYGKAVGNGVETVGAMGSMIGAIMSLFGLTSSQSVTNIGKLAHHAGTFIGSASDIIESYVSEKYLREIEAVLQEDQALSRPLAEWLNSSNELDTNVQTLFGVSLTSGTLNSVIKVFQEILKFSSSVKDFNAIISLMKQERYSVYIGNDVKVEKLEKFYHCLSASPQFAGRIRRILSVFNAQPGHVQILIDGVRAYHDIMSMSSSSVVPNLQGGLNPEIPTTREVSVFCVFQAISLAINFIAIIDNRNIIQNGTSKYSNALKQLTRSLSWELERMENL